MKSSFLLDLIRATSLTMVRITLVILSTAAMTSRGAQDPLVALSDILQEKKIQYSILNHFFMIVYLVFSAAASKVSKKSK